MRGQARPTKRFRIPGGLDGFFQAPSTEELLELGKTIEELRKRGANTRADTLEELDKKIRAAMRRPLIRQIEPDLEALLQAELIAVQAGPRAAEEPATLKAIRTALLSTHALRFVYLGGSRVGETRNVIPFGLIFGRGNYLIAADAGTTHPKTWRLDRMKDVEVLDQIAVRPANFSLIDFANGSFGFYQSEPEDVVLHILPHGVDDDFERWRFHPNQTVEHLADGGALVRFRASGMLELAWHLFTWGNKIEIVSPVSLRLLMTTELRVSLSQHDTEPRYAMTIGEKQSA